MNYHVLYFDFNKIANLWFLFSFYLSLNKDYFILISLYIIRLHLYILKHVFSFSIFVLIKRKL